MCQVIINGKEVIAKNEETILSLAKRENIDIPTLCFLKDCNNMGNCGVCLVEVSSEKDLVRACSYKVKEGDIINIGGRTSKKTSRLGEVFLDYITEEVLYEVIKNWEKFSKYVLQGSPRYLHGGHLMDMAGYSKFKEIMLDGVKLNKEAKVATRLNWKEHEYKANINVK